MATERLPNGLTVTWRASGPRSGLVREAKAHLLGLNAEEILLLCNEVLTEKGETIQLDED